jgi:hypothetical protein
MSIEVIIGGLIGIGGTLAGVIVNNYLASKREKKSIDRDNYNLMRDRIYGPISKYLSAVTDSLRNFEDLSYDKEMVEFESSLSSHFFSAIPEELRNEFLTLKDVFNIISFPSLMNFSSYLHICDPSSSNIGDINHW